MKSLKPCLWPSSSLLAAVTLLQLPILGGLSVDPRFDANLNSGAQVVRIIPHPGGQIYVAGMIEGGVARLNADGSVDETFDPGSGPDGRITDLEVTASGSLYVSGWFQTFQGVAAPQIAILLPNGAVDAGFTIGPAGANGVVDSLALGADGQLLAAGSFGRINGVPALYVAQVNGSGEVNHSFNSTLLQNMAIEAGADCVAVAPDGKILVGGNFTTRSGSARLIRLNPDGSLDSFDGNPGRMLYPKAIQVASDGSIYVAGVANAQNEGLIRRLRANGEVDTSFNGPVLRGCVEALLVQADGSIIAGGDFSAEGTDVRGLLRLKADGSVDPSWTIHTDGSVYSIAKARDGSLIVGGKFSQIGGIARNSLARIVESGAPSFRSSSSTQNGEFRAYLSAQPGLTYIVEASSDLQNWSVFATNTAITGGLEIQDTSALAQSKRFFRARLIQ